MRFWRTLSYRWYLSIAALITVGAVVAAYAPGLNGPFVFDDATNILLNPAIQVETLTASALYEVATSSESGPLKRPLSMLTLGVNYYFNQFQPLAFKTTNLAIHLLTGIALFLLTYRLVHYLHSAPKSKRRWGEQRIALVSLAICAAWLLHPLNLTPVLYVIQRMTGLASLFTVCGLLGYTVGREQLIRGETRGYRTIIISVLIFGALAVLSKETGVLLLLYLGVIEVTIFHFRTPPPLQETFRRTWIGFASGVFIITALVMYFKFDTIFSGYQIRNFDLTERLLTETRALWFYLRHIAIPDVAQLGVWHDDFPISKSILDPPTTLFSVIGIVALIAVSVFTSRIHPWVSFGLMWFLAGHALESTVLPLIPVQEHRNYLAQYGVLSCIIYYICYPHPTLKKTAWVRNGAVVALILLLGFNTYGRAHQWKDEWTLYNTEVQNHPNSMRAHSMLGILLHDNNHFHLAEQHFTLATELAKDQAEPAIQLIQHLFISKGKVPTTLIDELENRLLDYPFSYVTLWIYEPLLLTVRVDPILHRKLCAIYEKAISRTDIQLSVPAQEKSFSVLGANYLLLGEFSKSLGYFERAFRITPRPEYYMARANIHTKLGEREQARALLAQLRDNKFKLNPDQAQELTRLEKLIGRKPS